MQRCIELARNALGHTYPNPLVGSVVVYKGKIIGEGWHHKAGEAHAEVNAINNVRDQSLFSQSTIYVNLEPCAHHGKTPPCADLIIKNAIPRVVISNFDPHSAVAGKGVERLRKAGIEVITGVLKEKGERLNQRFFCFHEKNRPYVILKWAESADGFLDKDRTEAETGINWITQAETQCLVHQWRAQSDAIMVGGNTVSNDNPRLNVRSYSGQDPRPVIISSKNILEDNYHLNQNSELIWITTNPGIQHKYVEVVLVNQAENHPAGWLVELKKRNIQSIMVEGGASLLQSFIDAGVWDEARVLIGESLFHRGLKAPVLKHPATASTYFGKDLLKLHYS